MFFWGRGVDIEYVNSINETAFSSQVLNNLLALRTTVFLQKLIVVALVKEFSAVYDMIYRESQKECARIREGVPYVKVYRYNPKTYVQS